MTAELSSRIHTSAVTALAFVCTYVLAFYWNLDRPFWAGFTVFVISLPSIGQTLQKGVLRMFGTIAGAVAALVLLGLFAQERMLLLSVLSFYLCLMLYLMLTSVYYGYAFFISCSSRCASASWRFTNRRMPFISPYTGLRKHCSVSACIPL